MTQCEERPKVKRCRRRSKSPPIIRHDKYNQVNLVANTALAINVDSNLINPWGIVLANGTLWVADNATQKITVYTTNGHVIGPVISVTAGASLVPASPTGLVHNLYGSYLVNSVPAIVITATLQGTVNAYNSTAGTNSVVVVDNSLTGAIYKGLAITPNNLYLANFATGSIDVYTTAYTVTTLAGTFTDPTIPSTFSPFNVVYMDGVIYVLYALKNPLNPTHVLPGPGNGYISCFTVSGVFIRRFASNGVLNAPWAFIRAPESFGNAFLVGNYGDGLLHVFNYNGRHVHTIRNCDGGVLTIYGLRGLVDSYDYQKNIYFASGPGMTPMDWLGSYINVKKLKRIFIISIISVVTINVI